MGSIIKPETPAWVKPYDLNGKVAIVTGAGPVPPSLWPTCVFDPRQRNSLLSTRIPASGGKPSAVFIKTDVVDWAQLRALFDGAVEKFGRVDIVINGSGFFEPPFSSFWFNPDHSPLAEDSAECNPGGY